MITSRISSGFDIELQLGANWFRTALELFNEKGLLGDPGFPIVITNVQIIFDPEWDLQIDIANFPIPVLARAELNADGDSLILTSNLPGIDPKTIPFNALEDVSGLPVLVKLPGDADHENVIGLLANMKIHAEPQSEEPRDLETDPLARGNADDAVSFLPLGQHVAFGMSKESLKRFANNIWHTELRAEDGTHPLPDEEDKRGTWSKVSMSGSGGKIKLVLEGDIPVDSPLIDVVPDPHVTITLTITPTITDGVLSFSIDPDTDVDSGLLGDIFGAIAGAIGGGIVGGIIGFIVGLVTEGILAAVFTGLLIGAGIGLLVGIIVVEVVECIVEGRVQKQIKAKINGEVLPDILCDENGVVQVATPDPEEGGFNLSILDSIPPSIPIDTSFPEDEFLYQQSLLVSSIYDEFTIDSNGFGVAGTSGKAEKFQPEIASIVSFNYGIAELESITYRANGEEQTLSIDEVLERSTNGELKAPFKLFTRPEESTLRIPEGKIACVTLRPVAIHREDTVVEEIEFENGTRITVPDAIRLQDAAAITVVGYQLIHPRNYNAYYRAKANGSLADNLESLAEF